MLSTFDRLRATLKANAIADDLRAARRFLEGTIPAALRLQTGQTRSLLDVALQHAQTKPSALALEMGDERVSWGELADRTSQIAHVLDRSGMRRGDVVAVFAPNSPQYVAFILGVSRLGATAALINTSLRGAPLSHAVRVSGARTAIVQRALASDLTSALSESDDDGSNDVQVLVYDGGPMDDALLEAPSRSFPPVWVEPNDDFVHIYTSGTTGLPKPCPVSHARAILGGATFGAVMFEYEPGDKLYSVLPLYHTTGLMLGAGAAIMAGVPVAMRESFSASAFWSDVRRYQATAILYVGELCRYLVNSATNPDEVGNGVRVAVGNGLRPDVWPVFQDRFQIPLIREFYGATEAPGFVMNLSGRQGSVGRLPFGGLGKLRLVRYDLDHGKHVRDEKGFCVPCAPGEPGELLIRIPKNAAAGTEFRGYTDAEATNKKILRDVFKTGDQYFRSGDLLRQDDEGYYYFVDRMGDTFRWKGENVSTAEVADIVSKSDNIDQATIVGVQVPNMEGRAGLAAVVPVGEFEPSALAQAVRDLPHYAQPRFVRVMSSFDTTGTFKIRKNDLQRDGADPSAIEDPLFVLDGGAYVPLTEERWAEVLDGRRRL